MKNILFICCFGILGCGPKPFVIKSIPVKEVSIPQTHDVEKAKIKDLYIKARKPSFGLIKGFYKLPATRPQGASLVFESYGPMGRFSYKKIGKKEADFIITPMDGEEALAMAQAINHLLDAQVKLMEISLTDALSIAKEEKRSFHKKGVIDMGKTLLPNVNYLVSVDEVNTKDGRQILGRIIKSDGKLVAFKVMPKIHAQSLGTLLLSLMEEGLTRIKDEK